MNNPAAVPVPATQPVHCAICVMWERLPHAKRYTTPTTAQDTETALTIGFWLGRRTTQEVSRFCLRHGAMFEALDRQEAIRAEAEALARAAAVPENHVEQMAAIRARTEELLRKASAGTLPASPMTIPPVPPKTGDFALGPGPLLNGQTTPPNLAQIPSPLPSQIVVTPQFPNAEPPKEVSQPLPPAVCPACKKVNPGAGHVCDIQELKQALAQPVAESTPAVVPPPSNVGTPEGALEAARQPPTDGAVITFPCPTCQKQVKTGEIHAC